MIEYSKINCGSQPILNETENTIITHPLEGACLLAVLDTMRGCECTVRDAIVADKHGAARVRAVPLHGQLPRELARPGVLSADDGGPDEVVLQGGPGRG